MSWCFVSVVKPMRVSFQDAAACIGDAVTAYTALQCQARMSSGDTVFVVNGATVSITWVPNGYLMGITCLYRGCSDSIHSTTVSG